MIGASSAGFIAFACIAVALFRITPGPYRASLALPATSVALVALATPAVKSVALLVVFLLVAYAAVCAASSPARSHFVAGLAAVLLLFAYLKAYPLVSRLPFAAHVPAIVGLSYILIRSLQVMIDVHEGTIPTRPAFGRFVQFMLAWPMLFAGPIVTYQQFSADLDGMRDHALTSRLVYRSFARVVTGLFFVTIPGGLAYLAHDRLREVVVGSPIPDPARLAAAALAYLVFLYFNFAGYTSVVVGFGSLIGMTMPENFDLPWASRSFLDLWARWHMTLANWFKTYVFNPIVRALLMARPSGALVSYYAVAAFFVTFFLVGIWHGPTLPFVACGLALGTGVSVNKLWQIQTRLTLGKARHAALTQMWLYRVVCSASAMAYLALAIIPFWASGGDLVNLARRYSATGHLEAIMWSVVFMLPIAAVSLLVEPALRARRGVPVPPMVLGILLAALVIYLGLFPESVPPAVYQWF